MKRFLLQKTAVLLFLSWWIWGGQSVQSQTSFTVFVSAQPQNTCAGAPVYLSVDSIHGGSGTYFYNWIGYPGNFTSTQQHPTAYPLTSTTYTVYVNDGSTVVSEEVQVNVTLHPVAYAGADATICEDTPVYELTDASVSNQSNFYWSNEGNSNGSFSSNTYLHPTYTLGSNDTMAGYVQLVLHAIANPPCNGEDADAMTISLTPKPSVNAGNDVDICEDETATLTATASDYNSVVWNVESGNGYFNNYNSLQTIYYPGTNDINLGFADLSITAEAVQPCTVAETDDLRVNITRKPVVDAGSDGEICEGSNYNLSNSNASVLNSNSIRWESNGDGNFQNPYSINSAVYLPGSQDITNGLVILTLIAEGEDACTMEITDEIELSIYHNPEVDAGENVTICANSSYMLQPVVSDVSSVIWRTLGDGSFDDENIENAVYTPGTGDTIAGSVELELTGNAIAPCMGQKKDTVVLTLSPLPEINAGADDYVCDNASYVLNNSEAFHFQSLFWESSGDGVFDDPNALHPEYTPGVEDRAAGQTTLTLYGLSQAPCQDTVSDSMALSYIPSATANAGPDTIICVTESYPITAQIDHATSIHWSSSGTGTFDDATIATPIYTPDLQALPDGGDTLTVTVDNAACDPSTDSFFLAIQPEPIAHLSTHDTSFCVDDNAPVIAIQLSGNYHQYSTNISWHAIDENGNDGDGTFSDISIDNPVYTFSGQDILNQEIYLVFSAFALGPCDTPAHDTLHVSFYYKPMAYAGQDGEICEGDTIHLNGQAQYYESVYWFRIPNTGDIGTFTNNGTLEASYFPSEEDFENGEVGFQLDAYSPGNVCNTDMDTVHYNITRQSTAHAGDDFAICRDGIIELQGEAEYHSGIQWDALTTGALSGDGNWQDQNNTILNPVYTPSLGDIAAGEVHFVLSAWAMAPCDQPARDTIVVTLNDYPSASVGEDINICSSEPVILEAEADNFSSVNWTTSGSGSFSQQDLTSVYTFSEQDIESGIITITFTAQPKYPCDVPATDSLQVIIKPAPVIDLPDIVEAAYNMPFTFYPDVSGASGNYSFDWQPDSLFTNPNVRDASTYPFPYPGLSEYLVWLTVTDESNECATTDSVAVEVILGEVQIDLQAEPDYVCQNGSAILYANATGGTGIYEYYWQASPPDPEMAPFDSAVIITPEETTIYKITVNDGFSSPSSEIEITLQPNPDTPAIEGAETTETYQKEIYTTEGSDLAYYDWWARNGSVVAGQGTKEVTIEWGAPGNGTVYLQMASQYGCFGDTSLLNVSISTTGIETLEGVDDLKIYPNPANQMVHIFYELKQDKDLWFSIFNPVGQVVYMTGKQSQSVGRQQMTLPLEGLTNGMYIIRIKSDSRQIHYRIMKQ